MLLRSTRLLVLALALAGCAATAAPPALQPLALPANVRPDLDHRWLDATGAIRWPAADGFAAAPTLLVLPPGVLIDRFGSDGGRFFSPKGAAYAARALPYVCAKLTYRVYRIAQPLLAWSGTAAPWFDEPGGATQLETDAPAALLIADHVIEPVPAPEGAPCGKP